MKTVFKVVLIGVTFITSLFSLYLVRNWFVNKLEHRRTLFILVSDRTPNRVDIYTNCPFGTDLKFNSGIAAMQAGATENILIQDNLTEIAIRIVDKNQAKRMFENHNSVEWHKQSARLVKIVSDDSTSLCGHYKTIVLK